jgi:pyrroloquinoline quinone biosynthesis protein B
VPTSEIPWTTPIAVELRRRPSKRVRAPIRRTPSTTPRRTGVDMRVRVLGSAAGGGFPQWNCGCGNCRGVRDGSVRTAPRSQDSLAISADGTRWVIANASPDIRSQIEATAALRPRAPRDSPICGVLLTNGDLDHCLGLFSLREGQPLQIHATATVLAGLRDHNAFCRTLERFPGHVKWRQLELGARVPLLDVEGRPIGLSVEAIAAPGKLPIHLEGRTSVTAEDNVALSIRDELRGRTLVYAPGVAARTGALDAALREADCVLFDGTFWSSDELVRRGLGERTAQDMAHWPVGGTAGSLAFVASLPAPVKLYTHVNNTNPLLLEDSPERETVARAGIGVATDGLELEP